MQLLSGSLRRLAIASAIASVLSGLTAIGAAAASPSDSVHQEILPLNPVECAQLNKVLAGQGMPSQPCWIVHRSGFRKTLMRSGTTTPTLSSGPTLPSSPTPCPAYWYWSKWDTIGGFANIWTFTLSEDGVANGCHVWQWDVWCTPGGFQAVVTNCFYWHNGGGWPDYKMGFGLDGTVCIIKGWTLCYNHGMRRTIGDSGNPVDFSAW